MLKLFWEKVFGWVVQGASWDILKVYVLPLVLPAGGIKLGLELGVEWFYIYVGASVLLAASITALLRFDEWKYKVTTKDKLWFSNVKFITHLSTQNVLESVRFGVVVKNHATFPIQLDVQEIYTELHLTETVILYPSKVQREQGFLTLAPQNEGWWCDDAIPFDEKIRQALRGSSVSVLIHATLRYGRTGKLTRTLDVKKKAFVVFTHDGKARLDHWIDV